MAVLSLPCQLGGNRSSASTALGLKLATFDLFGQLPPLSGDILQTFFRVAIGRALGLLLCLCRMLAVLFGS
jgi:hypothetical protein